MSDRAAEMEETWERSFQAQIEAQAYNTAPVEAVVRTVAYWLRANHQPSEHAKLHFLDLGCGAGPNMVWLAEKGIRVSGIDISPTALGLAKRNLARLGLSGRLDLGSITELPYPDSSFDGVVEACVLQHLDRADRLRAFAEVARVLKPGGVFAGYLLSQSHSLFKAGADSAAEGDAGTLMLRQSGKSATNFHLSNIGLAHFFARDEFARLLPGFRMVDPCMTDYDLPRDEAARRGYSGYRQGMWALYAVK